MNDLSTKLLTEMFTKYEAPCGPDVNLELEIRFKNVTREVFIDLYNSIRNGKDFSNMSVECSIDIVSENIYERSINKADENRYIRRMVFNGQTPTSDTYHKKKRVMRSVVINDYIKYTVGLSEESLSRKFTTATGAIIRFKLRFSAEYITPAQKWRFDLTAVKQGSLQDLGNNLKGIRQGLFGAGVTTATFGDSLNANFIDSYEIEVENINPKRKVSISDMDIVKKIFGMLNPEYLGSISYQAEIYEIAKYIYRGDDSSLNQFKRPESRLKQLGNQAIAITKNTYYADVYPPKEMYGTIKTDGMRVFVFLGEHFRIIFADTLENLELATPHKPTIVDAELLDSTIYIFDVMVIDGQNISDKGFEHRIQYLEQAAAILNTALSAVNIHPAQPDSKTPAHSAKYTVVAKKYIKLDNLEAGFKEVWADKTVKSDGIIITRPGESYVNTKNYKWKPYSHNTIDFYAVKCPQKMLGIKPYEVVKGKDLYLLFVGITHVMREKLGLGLVQNYRSIFGHTEARYYPVQFSPSANPLAYLYYYDSSLPPIDGQIIELARNKENTEWEFHLLRSDRKVDKNYYGNDFRVAELTYLNYIDPFEFEDLYRPSTSYFTKTATSAYTAPNKYKRFVISTLLKDNLSGVKWVIDEAAGRGADLHRYQEIGVENALFTDIDPTAITELIRRKFAFFAVKRNTPRTTKTGGAVRIVSGYDSVHDISYDKLIVKDTKALTVHTLVADLKSPCKDLVASTFQFGINPGLIDGIVCNFALHYMCDTIEHLRNVLMFNAKMLKVGGIFVFTVMDGAKVFGLLSTLPEGKQWELREDGVLKYALRKKYSGNKLSHTGQTISVLLPFSDEMYDEPLCNVDIVIAEAAKLGFQVELNSSMSAMLDRFATANRALHAKLTDGDKQYIDLHKFVSLRKVK